MATLKEKIGYGFGDMSSSMFWKIFSYYLPFFYSNIFGLSLADAGLLMLVTRIWDAVSDPMMGVIADRTHTRWGKYRCPKSCAHVCGERGHCRDFTFYNARHGDNG